MSFFSIVNGVPTVDEEDLAKEISKRTGLKLSTVRLVLETEDELHVEVGLYMDSLD